MHDATRVSVAEFGANPKSDNSCGWYTLYYIAGGWSWREAGAAFSEPIASAVVPHLLRPALSSGIRYLRLSFHFPNHLP